MLCTGYRREIIWKLHFSFFFMCHLVFIAALKTVWSECMNRLHNSFQIWWCTQLLLLKKKCFKPYSLKYHYTQDIVHSSMLGKSRKRMTKTFELRQRRERRTQCSGVPATIMHFNDNFERSPLEPDSEIKRPVMLFSNYSHMCWERETLVKEQTEFLPLHTLLTHK